MRGILSGCCNFKTRSYFFHDFLDTVHKATAAATAVTRMRREAATGNRDKTRARLVQRKALKKVK